MAIRLLGAVLALFLFACATPHSDITAQAVAPACTTGTIKDAMAKAAEQELDLKADYTGARKKEFAAYLHQFIDNPMMTDSADRILVFQKGKAGLILFFKDGCALGHAIGPWVALEPFVGRTA